MSIPQVQKALVVPECSAAFDLQNVPVPRPKSGELLVRVKAAALNPADWKIQKHDPFSLKYPSVFGLDFAGEVVEAGENTLDFAVGDRVFGEGNFWSNRVAGFQQFTILPPMFAAKIPAGISFDDASTLPLALATSFVALYNEPPYGLGFQMPTPAKGCGKYTTTPILIIGGATSVGQAALQLAKLSGFSPIITIASRKNETALMHLGADHVVDRMKRDEAITAEIKNITGKRLMNVFDCVSSPETQHMALNLVENRGKVATVLDPVKDAKTGDKTLFQTFGLSSVPQNVSPNRVEVLQGGLRGIVSGLERLEKGDISRLKLVVHPQETAG